VAWSSCRLALVVLEQSPQSFPTSKRTFPYFDDATVTPAFDAWWEDMLRLWVGELSAIVWLDAPDDVLWRRINGRSQLHRTKGEGVEEGHRFLAASSDAWYEASVAFGTDPAEARAAADRTTAFYTGTPEPGAGAGQHG